jgi:hypothetical protein
MDNMQVVIKYVTFIRDKGLNHRQFQDYFKIMKAGSGDVAYFSEVKWLSRILCTIDFIICEMK